VLSDRSRPRQEVFNAAILAVAVVMLGWHNLWMASHGRELAGEMKAMGAAVAGGDKSLVAMAVRGRHRGVREGARSCCSCTASRRRAPRAGRLCCWRPARVALGAAVSYLLYLGLLAIPLHRLFSVTTWLIALVAAGMAGQAAAILANIDLIPSFGFELWDTSWLLRRTA